MNIRATLLIAALALAGCRAAAPHALRHGYYVWNYDWTPAVVQGLHDAAREEGVAFLVMAGAVGRDQQPHPQWEACAATGRPVIPVLRVFNPAAAWMEAEPDRLQREVVARFRLLRADLERCGLPANALQLDLDCPERLLPHYARFLRALRPALPGVSLTVTALPCHLDRRAFAEVADACDGYTLQVHGLVFPKRLGDPAPLLDPAVARAALARAGRIGRPFDVALPTYAQELAFERAGGRFLGLVQPGDPPPDAGRCVTRISAPAARDICALLEQAGRLPNCRGVHWFRLPVPGDRLAWDLDSLRCLRAGRPLEPRVTALVQGEPDGRQVLIIRNQAALADPFVRVRVRWPQAQGDYGLNGARAEEVPVPGLLPAEIIAPVPAPGMQLTAGWFRVSASAPPPGPDDITLAPAPP